MTRGIGAGRPAGGRRVRGLDADQRRAQRRRDLLDAALTLFGERGYIDVSIEEICQNAYVGTKGFYELFGSKEDCYLALFELLAGVLQAEMTGTLRESGNDPDRLIEAFARAVVRDPRVPAVVFLRSAIVSVAVEHRRRENRRWAAAFVGEVWRQNLSPSDESAAERFAPIALGLVGGMFELVADWLHRDDPHSAAAVDRLIAELTAFHRVVYGGLAAR